MKNITDKFYKLLGMCRRAGKLVSGSWMVEDSIRRGRAELVILSSEASANTTKKLLESCKHRQIDVVVIGSKVELGRSIGQPDRTVIAINDRKFKTMILDALPKSTIVNMGVIDECQK